MSDRWQLSSPMHPFPLLPHLWASRSEDLGSPLLFQTTETPAVHRTVTLAFPLTIMSICASAPAFIQAVFSRPAFPSPSWCACALIALGVCLHRPVVLVGSPQTQRQMSQVFACNGKYYGKNKRVRSGGLARVSSTELIMLCDNLLSKTQLNVAGLLAVSQCCFPNLHNKKIIIIIITILYFFYHF